MQINNFERYIEEKILVRGKKYFADGLVADIWSESPNCYQAVVEGSIPYDVEIHVDANGVILHHYCDCPYDWGEYCKHEAAVLFAIRRLLEQGAIPKRQGQKQGLRSILLRQTKDQLVNLLCDLAEEYDLREDIFYHLDGNDVETQNPI